MPAIDSRPQDGTKDVVVYITGFGPFGRIADNPSSKLLGSLPPSISIPGYTIHLRPHSTPIKVAYTTVSRTVREIWAVGGWDYILHLGVGREGGYELETVAHVGTYIKRDVDGLPAPPDAGGPPETSQEKDGVRFGGVHGREGGTAEGQGRALKTGVDVDAIVRSVSERVRSKEGEGTGEGERADKGGEGERVQIRKSTDAGMYLCEYIYSRSLLQAEARGGEWASRVLFMHVPPEGKRYGVETGAEVVKAVVEGMARQGGPVDREKNDAKDGEL